MRYVTFYYEILSEHIADLEVHENKEDALKWFNRNYRNYFEINAKFKADKLPVSYGYPFRKYYGMSALAFKKAFGFTVDDALKDMRGTE